MNSNVKSVHPWTEFIYVYMQTYNSVHGVWPLGWFSTFFIPNYLLSDVFFFLFLFSWIKGKQSGPEFDKID